MLPKHHPFIKSIKVLFDILDVDNSGFIFLSDIEEYWTENNSAILPQNIIQCLKYYTNKNGLLSFNDFVSGLQLAMNSSEARSILEEETKIIADERNIVQFNQNDSTEARSAKEFSYGSPSSQPLTIMTSPKQSVTSPQAGVTSSGAKHQHLHQSQSPQDQNTFVQGSLNSDWRTLLEPRPDVAFAHTRKYEPPKRNYCEEIPRSKSPRRSSMDDNTSPSRTSLTPPHKQQTGRYHRVREPRRHTLQSGVDYNLVKTMKQLEVERDVLLQTAELLEQSRLWLDPYLLSVRDRQKQLSTTGRLENSDHGSDTSFILPRLSAVNNILQGLVEGSSKGFPSNEDNDEKHRLLAQNEHLKKVAQDAESRIKQLEDEKILLVKEIFEERSKRRPVSEDSLM